MLSLGSSDISISSSRRKYCKGSLSHDVYHSNASNIGEIIFSSEKRCNLILKIPLSLLVAYKHSELEAKTVGWWIQHKSGQTSEQIL